MPGRWSSNACTRRLDGSIPRVLADGWSFAVRPSVGLWLAYSLGLVAATGICLPSFYFYGLLAGVKMTFLQVVTHCLKGQAATAIMLIGILPIYVAVAPGHADSLPRAWWTWTASGAQHRLGAALCGGLMGRLLDLPRFHAFGRHFARPLSRPTHLLSAAADAGLGRVLHGCDAAHDLCPVDAVHELRSVSRQHLLRQAESD